MTMRPTARTLAWLAPATIVLSAVTAVTADPPPAEQEPPSTPPATDAPEQPEKPADPPPSLDELLGLGGGDASDDEDAGDQEAADPDGQDPAATRTGDAELDAALGLKEMDDLFRRALDGMREAADQLKERRTGIDTQRTQEEVMRRLEALIDSAARNQQQQQSSSSSQSQSQQQQNPGQQQSRGQQEQQQQQEGSPQPAGAESGEGLPPGFQDGLLEGELDEAGEEWGSLPERIREMLLQGRNERFSSLYERLTRAYYRRLAEEGTP